MSSWGGGARSTRCYLIARSKRFEGEEEIPLAGFTPCQRQTLFKRQLETRIREGEREYSMLLLLLLG